MINKSSKQAKADRLLEEVREELTDIGIPISEKIAPIEINTTAKKRLGQCAYNRAFGEYEINIGEFILDHSEEVAKRTIAHELLHTCEGCMNHGEKFKAYADLANTVYNYGITITTNYNDIGVDPGIVYKYEVKCSGCGATSYKMRATSVTKHPENYRCGKCKGHLQVAEIGKDKQPKPERKEQPQQFSTEDFRKLTYEQLIARAKKEGVTWKRNDHKGIDRMRATVALKKKLGNK